MRQSKSERTFSKCFDEGEEAYKAPYWALLMVFPSEIAKQLERECIRQMWSGRMCEDLGPCCFSGSIFESEQIERRF